MRLKKEIKRGEGEAEARFSCVRNENESICDLRAFRNENLHPRKRPKALSGTSRGGRCGDIEFDLNFLHCLT